MINKKRAKKSESHWRHEAREARQKLWKGERMSFEDFIAPRIRQKEATNRLRNT
jgi:uncharacterized coiled-coil DUF342 family protein